MIEMRKYLFLISSIIFMPSMLLAQEAATDSLIEFNVQVKPDTAKIGDEIKVIIDITYPEELELSEPAIKQNDKNIAVKSGPEAKSQKSGDKKTDRYTFKIAAFNTGEVELPYFEFYYYDDEGNQHTRLAPIETVYIKSLLPDEAVIDSLQLSLDNKDIIGPKALPIIWWPYAVGAGAIILLALAFLYYQRRRTGLIGIPEKPPEPPFDLAIRRLNDLERKDLAGKGKYKDFYVELSEILRHYIDGRFEIPASESTTFELRRILRHPEITRDQSKDILDMLSRADMVKFAKQTPQVEMPSNDFALVKKFVVDTKPGIEIQEKVEVSS